MRRLADEVLLWFTNFFYRSWVRLCSTEFTEDFSIYDINALACAREEQLNDARRVLHK